MWTWLGVDGLNEVNVKNWIMRNLDRYHFYVPADRPEVIAELDPSHAVLVCRPIGAGCGEDLAGGVGEGVGGGVLVAGDVQGDLLQGT